LGLTRLFGDLARESGLPESGRGIGDSLPITRNGAMIAAWLVVIE
jgi:hypothetical protein